MARRNESPVRTFLRVEAIALQGVLFTLLEFLFCILISPYTLVAQYCRLAAGAFLLCPWWKAVLMLFPYIGLAFLDTIVIPFVALANGVSTIIKVTRAEWQNRNLTASDGQSRNYLAEVLGDYAPDLLRRQEEADGEDAE